MFHSSRRLHRKATAERDRLTLDQDAFTVDDHVSHYWLGFMYASLHVNGDKYALVVSPTQRGTLEKFVAYCHYQGKITRGKGNVCIRSKALRFVVTRYHMTTFPQEFAHSLHFWRGYLEQNAECGDDYMDVQGDRVTLQHLITFLGDDTIPIMCSKQLCEVEITGEVLQRLRERMDDAYTALRG